ncbi:hypothetical protein ACEZCY_14430 [Streptacidiphilus sp. N1-12]|uniref:Uncharacterized protein n=2 Tax=Streptacidiphilus alkalitolerans TaxID=3342712 RepID=A0ABV6V9Q4_9ACTN
MKTTRGAPLITFRLSNVSLPGHGYVKRARGGATVILNCALYTEEQAAALTVLAQAGLGEGVFGWWDGEIAPLDSTAEVDLPIGQTVM